MSEKEQVARTSAIAGGTLALLKLAIGLLSGSLSLLSEGIHSTLDFVVTLITWLSVKTSDAPADREHHYGHGKIENLSAFAQAILLMVTAFWIITRAYGRLAGPNGSMDMERGWYAAVAVVAVSIGVDLSRSRALAKAARRFNSQALEADAIHFGTELLASTAVLAGLLVVKFAGPKFQMADPLAAIIVAGVMLFTSLRLGRRAADVLMDRAPEGVEQQILGLILGVPGVRDVNRVRARQSGDRTFVDATIVVDSALDLPTSHQIADNVELRVTERFPKLDIVVHVEPADPSEDQTEAIRVLAEGMKIKLHAIRVRHLHGHLYINFHAEFPPDVTLAAAHKQVTDLEELIRRRLPQVAEIDSHMEPLGIQG